MPELLTMQDLANGHLDVKALGEAANGDENTIVTTRTGNTYPSAERAINIMFQNGGLPAKPFATKALMTASALVDGQYAMVTDDTVNNGLYVKTAGAWVKSGYDPLTLAKDDATTKANAAKAEAIAAIDTVVKQDYIPNYAAVWADPNGNTAMGIRDDGTVYIPILKVDNLDGSNGGSGSQVKKVTSSTSDSILIIGDSHSEGMFNLKDKSYISNLSNLSDYRFKNISLSGHDAADLNYKIVNDIAYLEGITPQLINAKYAIIATYGNDRHFISGGFKYYMENLARLIESVKALGVEPILATVFKATAEGVSAIKQVAINNGVRFIDCTALDNELGGLKIGIFHEFHPGVRTNAVFWLPILASISKLPQPKNSIKIYRRRPSFTVADIKDLLFKDRVGRYAKFKEVSITHKYFAESEDELYDDLEKEGYFLPMRSSPDEYLRLGGAGIAFTDYGLIELVADGAAQTLDSLSLNIATDAQVYIRDYFDTSSNIPARNFGGDGSPSNPDYAAKWNNPRGAWKLLTLADGKVMLSKAQLKGYMLGDKIQLLLHKVGGFTLTDVSFEYAGGYKLDKFVERDAIKTGSQLLTNNTFDTLSNWTLVGSPSTLVPIDNYNSPRLPSDHTLPVNNVITISSSKTIGRSVVLPKLNTRYRLTVWCRNFPKAYIDNSVRMLDPNQVISRVGKTYPTDAPITSDTADLRTLQLKYSFTPSFNEAKSVIANDFACLGWRGVEFDIYVTDSPRADSNLTFNLSCLDGEIQIAKIDLTEII